MMDIDTTDPRVMYQVAPWPSELAEMVKTLVYEPDWVFHLYREYPRDEKDGKVVGQGATLSVTTTTFNSYHPERGRTYRVRHLFIVPAATYTRASWRRWLLNRILDIHLHEACEWFQVDGERPYSPNHSPGEDPYLVRELTTDELRRTSYLGELKAAT